jgi:transglutaminase-like putative cysteine protease
VKKTKIAAPMLLAWFCSTAVPAPQPYRTAPPSGWVTPIADAPLAQSGPEGPDDYDFLLVDQQVRLGAVTEQYSRYAERMVNQASVDRSAQVSLEIDPRHEKLLVHDVRVFRGGRTIDKLADARRSLLNRESKLDEGLIDGRVTLHLLLQDVRVGDVLDYSYTIERTDPFGERGYNSWFMTQWATPVRRFRLRIQHRAKHALQILDHSGLPKPAVIRRGEWTETTWDASDVAALPDEDLRPAWHIRYPRVEVSEFADWNAVRAWAQPLYELQPRKDAALQEFIGELIAEPDELTRLSRALRFVQDDIRYTGLEIGAGAYRPTQPGEVLARRFGDCKDKVLLLVTILRALGIEAYPALVNSRQGQGVAVRAPGPGAFDHVIAKVRWKDRDYWLDATASGQGGRFDTTVQADFGLALVLDPSRHGLERIPARQSSEPFNHVIETFDLREGTRKTAALSVKTTYRDEEADAMRVRMRSQTATQLGKEYLEYYRKSYAGIRMVKPIEVEDVRDANRITMTETYQIDEPFEKQSDGKWKFHLAAYLVSDRTGVPKQTDRTTPLARRFPMDVRHEILAYLPGHWNIEPAEVAIVDPAFDYQSSTRFTDGTLALDYRLRSTRDHVPVKDLKKFLVNLDEAHDDAFYTLTDSEGTAGGVAPPPPKGPGVAMIVMPVLGLGAGIWLAFLMTRLRWRLADAEEDAPQGLYGWMIPPIIGVLSAPVLLSTNIHNWFHEIGTAAQLAALAVDVRWMLLSQLGLLSMGMVVSLMTAWLLFTRKHAFPFAFITLQVLMLSILAIDVTIVFTIGEDLESVGYRGHELVTRPLIAALWIGYVLLSQRVRATFVNPRRAEPAGPVPAASGTPAPGDTPAPGAVPAAP